MNKPPFGLFFNRLTPSILLILLSVTIIAGCISTTVPESEIEQPPLRDPDSYPAIPFEDPNILGQMRGTVATQSTLPSSTVAGEVLPIDKLADIDAALSCLASGQSVYGMTRANTNVRAAPVVNACRMGRAPLGRLVRIDSIYEAAGTTPLASVSGVPAPTVAETTTSLENVPFEEALLGFEEDVKPIFDRSCASCHNNVAKLAGLQVNEYSALMRGSENGVVVVPGNAGQSWLWDQIRVGTMPLSGELPDNEKAIVKQWINSGARRNRPVTQPARQTTTSTSSLQTSAADRVSDANLWLQISASDVDLAANRCDQQVTSPQTLVSNRFVELLTCGTAPTTDQLALIRQELAPIVAAPVAQAPAAVATPVAQVAAPAPVAAAPVAQAPAPPPAPSGAGVSVSALGLSPPSDSDPFFVPRGGFCIGQKQARLQDNRSITAMAFAPDGRLFLALDTVPFGENVDNIILTDSYHPSRSIAVFDSNSDSGFNEIMTESPRITGLAYHQGALYVSRSGEVGQIPDGGQYQKLAGGFAVEGRLWHANNGIAIQGGNLYISAGGIRDGWSDGPIEGMDEAGAQSVVAGGNPYASRLVRASLSQLLSSRNINAFETAARGFRNPYGLAAAPDGRLWLTDNGATNVPENISAGDEVNVFDPRQTPSGTAESSTPFYGFPLALTGANAGWKTPVITMPNSGAPTGITWAYNTVFYAQYGREPGLYRLGRNASGNTISERIMMGWPIVAVATAPDGALWIGSASGRLYRMTTGC